MIEAFVGLIGGGKSFSAVARMAEYLASGGVVCTNIELMLEPWYNFRYAEKLKDKRLAYPVDGVEYLNFEENRFLYNAMGLREYLRRKYKWELQDGQIIDLNNDQISGSLHEHLPAGTAEKPVLVVIDEAVDFFDADDRSTANREFLTFLRYSRKLCIDIIMIAQEFTELNKRIRNQVQWVWTFKDLGTERIPVMRMRYPPPYRFNIACAQWSGRQYGKDNQDPVRITMRWKDQDIFACYRTEELFREVKVLRGVQTNFSKNGNDNGKGKGKKRMNKIERTLLVVCLIVSVLSFIRKGEASSVDSKGSAEEAKKKEMIAEGKEESVQALAELVKELEESEPEEVQAFMFDDQGGGSFFTESGRYSVGDYYAGRQILKVEKDGYMYMDQEGQISKCKFRMRVQRVPENSDDSFRLDAERETV